MALDYTLRGANRHPKASREADMHDVMLSQGATSHFRLTKEGQTASTTTYVGANRHYEASQEGERHKPHDTTSPHHAMSQRRPSDTATRCRLNATVYIQMKY